MTLKPMNPVLALTGNCRARWKKVPDPLHTVEKKMVWCIDTPARKMLHGGFERVIRDHELWKRH
jgi:hypothetical protein